MSLGKVAEDIKAVASRYGLEAEESGEFIRIKHPEAPLIVEIKVEGGKAVVELKVGDDIDEYVENLLGEDEDPREALEEALEEMVRLVDTAVSRLSREGFKVERRTREGILDVYDAIEARLEEES